MPLMRGEPPKDLATARVLRCVAPSQAEKSRPDSNTRRSDALAAIFRCLQGRLGDVRKRRTRRGLGDRRVDAADPFGSEKAELCKMAAHGVAAQRLLLDRNPRVWTASTRLVAPRSCWARTACRGATWPRLDRLRVGRVMGHFRRLQIPLTPQILLGRAVFGQKCEFSHGLCIIPVRQHSAFYGQDIGNHR